MGGAVFKKKSKGYVGHTYFDNMWSDFFLEMANCPAFSLIRSLNHTNIRS